MVCRIILGASKIDPKNKQTSSAMVAFVIVKYSGATTDFNNRAGIKVKIVTYY